MADTTYVDGSTLLTADTMNDLNRLHYTILSDPADVAAVKDTLHSAPGAIGDTTPSTGAFTTITSTGGTQVTGAVVSGYGTGAGGTVTQATSKSTAVTLNKPCGQITTHNASLAAGATVLFQLLNSTITATDVIVLSIGMNTTSYRIDNAIITGAGSVYLNLTNISGGALAEAVPINFAAIKSVTS